MIALYIFSSRCGVYQVAKVVHGNRTDNHCNWPDTLPSVDVTTRALLLYWQTSCFPPRVEHTHIHTYTRTHARARIKITTLQYQAMKTNVTRTDKYLNTTLQTGKIYAAFFSFFFFFLFSKCEWLTNQYSNWTFNHLQNSLWLHKILQEKGATFLPNSA